MKKVAFVNLAVSVGRVPSWELFCTKNFTLPPCYGRFVKKKLLIHRIRNHSLFLSFFSITVSTRVNNLMSNKNAS